MNFDCSYDGDGISLRPKPDRIQRVRQLLNRHSQSDLAEAANNDRQLALALADLREVGEDYPPGPLEIGEDTIRMSHQIAGSLNSQAADALGLPPLVHLVLRTDAEGLLGSPSFRLRCEWFKDGRRQSPGRVGAILQTADGDRRLPTWIQQALDVAAKPGVGDASHWEALARFRRQLDPGVEETQEREAASVSMTDFLQSLEVRLADCFSLAPKESPTGIDFDVVPFSGTRVEEVVSAGASVDETQAELRGLPLKQFQRRVRERGALPAYRLAPGEYLVVDRSAKPALEVMVRKQRAAPAERGAFVRNPRQAISVAIENHLRESGQLDGLTAEGEEEAVAAAAEPKLVETKEYSERVIGKTRYEAPDLELPSAAGTGWMPEGFADEVVESLRTMDDDAVESLCGDTEAAIETGGEVEVGGVAVPATEETLRAFRDVLAARRQPKGNVDGDDAEEEPQGPTVLETEVNFDQIRWQPEGPPRVSGMGTEPVGVRTALKEHQRQGVVWQIAAWRAGLPGVLNADEQGLGKTLQTLAFMRWLKEHMADATDSARKPILVVAPTSLLRTWENEATKHLEAGGLGQLLRLYGSALAAYKRAGAQGVDTQTGEAKLDLDLLEESVAEGKGHRFWLLTTYTTLTNYQHSLARIPFALVVFDEIQALKNPASLRAFAARAVRADFRIGLTGTPIENRCSDLWAVMDQLCPGALDTLQEFNKRYSEPDEGNMQELYDRVFKAHGEAPALAIRRTKDEAAKDLPDKARRLHPREMPERQAQAYAAARLRLAEGSPRGTALKVLHSIRAVSVHPSLSSADDDERFIAASARLRAAFDVLRSIRADGERALVFIEHRRMQYRFVELAKREFGLKQIDLINGSTPIAQRQAAVDRFQRHLEQDGGFDLLVLGTRAAGTGLTLTAATHVVHLSRWWNPAVEEQCNDRVHRIGQDRPVTVHVPMAIHPEYRAHSFDCLLQSLMSRKRRLASAALWPMGDTATDVGALQRGVADSEQAAGGDAVEEAITQMFERDGLAPPQFGGDGSVVWIERHDGSPEV